MATHSSNIDPILLAHDRALGLAGPPPAPPPPPPPPIVAPARRSRTSASASVSVSASASASAISASTAANRSRSAAAAIVMARWDRRVGAGHTTLPCSRCRANFHPLARFGTIAEGTHYKASHQ